MEAGFRRPPFTFAKRHGLIVTEDRGDHVLAVARPGIAIDSVQETRRFVGRPLRLQSVSPQEFDALLSRPYEGQTAAHARLMDRLQDEAADLDAQALALPGNHALQANDEDPPFNTILNGLLRA